MTNTTPPDEGKRSGQRLLAFPVRDIAIMAYQKYRADANVKAAAIWQSRATLVAEAIVAALPNDSLHYQRVIRPQLK